MKGTTADQWKKQEARVVLVAAGPKLGKTCFATSAPGKVVVVACDLGEVTIYPGKDPKDVLILPYQELTREMGDMGTSVPKRDVFTRLMRDLTDISRSIRAGEPLKLEEGQEFPLPDTVVLDGFSRLNTMLVDGKLALNNMAYTDDLPKNIRFNFWGKRGTDVYTIVQQYASLGVNVVITSWIKAQTKTDSEGKSFETGVMLPDIGGKMDLITPGTVASSLLCFSRAGRYYVRTKPDATTPWLGVRNVFNLGMEVDVTVEAGKPSPWERVFGVANKQ